MFYQSLFIWRLHKRLNQTRKVVARAMRKDAEQELNDLSQNFNSIFFFLRRMKKEGQNMEGGRCFRGRDGRLDFIEKDREKFGRNTWKRS